MSIHGVLCFQVNFPIIFSISEEDAVRILTGIALNLCITSGNMHILIVLVLYLSMSSSSSLFYFYYFHHRVFQVFGWVYSKVFKVLLHYSKGEYGYKSLLYTRAIISFCTLLPCQTLLQDPVVS